MKKLLISISLLGFCLFGAFAAEFSLGGYVGSVVAHDTDQSTLTGLPQFGITLNVDFENFGFNTSFGIDFWAQSWKNNVGNTVKNNISNESILITPYIPFRYKKFMFTFGPTVGFKFYQYKLTTTDYKRNNHWLFVVLGGEFETRYAITDHLKAFLNLGLFTDSGKVQTKYERTGLSNYELVKFRWVSSNLYFVPKIGVVYTF